MIRRIGSSSSVSIMDSDYPDITKLNPLGFLLLIVIVAAGCAAGLTRHSPKLLLSPERIRRYHLTEAELLQLKYYISDDIYLWRPLLWPADVDSIPASHKIEVLEGRAAETIRVSTSTSLSATHISRNTIWISFEEGDSLEFKVGIPNSSGTGDLNLYRLAWRPEQGTNRLQVKYGDYWFYTTPRSTMARLQVWEKEIEEIEKKRR